MNRHFFHFTGNWIPVFCAFLLFVLMGEGMLHAEEPADQPAVSEVKPSDTSEEIRQDIEKMTESAEPRRFFIRKYKVMGAKSLPRGEVEKAVYPHMGPYCTVDDIEKARAALEKAYMEHGYQAVAVQSEAQPDSKGIVHMRVIELAVGRLRVRGSRYFSLDQIKEEAPSLAEGKVPDFNKVTQDIIRLNRIPDRRITPAINPGRVPGTLDVDLIVKDALPIHGNMEFNNRYSADTSSLRLNTTLSYGNVWQLGHTVGLGYQVSPLDPNETQSLSAYYLIPVPDINGFSVMFQGSEQNSNVSTLGSINSLGAGESLGIRGILTLPARKGFYHSIVGGVDYKYTDQDIQIGGVAVDALNTPVTYFPWSLNYSSSWLAEQAVTDMNVGMTFNVRGLGSDSARFSARRNTADANFIYLRGDLSHTHDLPEGFQVFARAQGQIADRPLISNEQFSGGGLDSARGYLESLYNGDNAIFSTLELRSPSVGGYLWKEINDWRFYTFVDAGQLSLKNPLPEQTSHFDMASWGGGSRIRIEDHLNAAMMLGFPMVFNSQFRGPRRLLTFQLWYTF